MVARPQTAVGHPCTWRTVFESCHAGCNHRSVPLEWCAPNRDASVLAIVHSTAGAHPFHHRRDHNAPIGTQPGTNMVVPVSAGRGARAAATLACAGEPV